MSQEQSFAPERASRKTHRGAGPSAGARRPRVWVASELYYPEDTSTGYFLTGIAEGLAREDEVGALAAQPTYAARRTRSPWRERHGNVDVRRCWSTTFSKDVAALRLLNVATISISFLRAGLLAFRRGDVVIVVTNPPTLPFFVWLAARCRGARMVLLIHDVYPEVLVATGILRRDGVAARALSRLVAALYERAERIVVLGRDMKEIVLGKCPTRAAALRIIPNWGDTQAIRPLPKAENAILRRLGASEQFVVLYGGNIGRTHGIETVLAAAELLRGRPDIVFLVAGEGAKRAWVERAVFDRDLTAVRMLPRVPQSELNDLLNACDVAVISLMPGMAGVSVPSRLYNLLAAGRPILAVAEPGSEVAMVVTEEGVGRVVEPGDGSALAEAILVMKAQDGLLREMGERARAVATSKYSYEFVVGSYRELLDGLLPGDD